MSIERRRAQRTALAGTSGVVRMLLPVLSPDGLNGGALPMSSQPSKAKRMKRVKAVRLNSSFFDYLKAGAAPGLRP